MSDPVTQAFLVDVQQRSDELHLAGHKRLRESLNLLAAEVRQATARTADHFDDHSKRLVIIETTQDVERKALQTRKTDQRDRNILIATIVSIVVSVVMRFVFH